jgi:hypothetical protein
MAFLYGLGGYFCWKGLSVDKRLRLRLHLLAFLGIAAMIILANAWWLHLDQRPFAWDESIHYMGAAGYSHALSQGGLKAWKTILYQSDFYPPAGELAGTLFFKVAGVSPHAASFLSVFYLLAIVLLLGLLGRELFTTETGLLAGLLFSASSMIVLQSKYFMLDIPLVFWFCLGFYCYVRSENFSRRNWALFYGLILGLALLTKWSALFFLGFSPAIMVGLAARRNSETWKKAGVNLLLAYLLAGLLAAPWYSVHFIKLFKNTRGYIYQRGVLLGNPPLLSPASWFYYLLGLVRQMSWPLALIVLPGLVLFFRQKSHWLLFLVWTGAPYFILTMIRNKDYRYTLPLVALFCLMSMVWIQKLSTPWRRGLAGVVAGLACLQFVYVHTGAPGGWGYTRLSKEVFGAQVVEAMAPDRRPWPLAEILKDVASRAESKTPTLRVIPDEAHFSQVAFSVEQSRHPGGVRLASISDWPSFTDFAVTKTGSLGLPFALGDRMPIHEALGNTATPDGQRFALIKTYPLPDGSQAQLYQRQEITDPRSGRAIVRDLRQELNNLLSAYIKDPRILEIEFETLNESETRSGHFQAIRIRATDGLLGDFKHKPLGLPFAAVDLELKDVRLDLVRTGQGRIVAFRLDELRVHRLEIHADDLNQALARSQADLKHLRVVFQKEGIEANWLSRIPARVRVALAVTPDPLMEGSDNLSFRLLGVGTPSLQLPGRMIQPLLEDFNPLLKSAGLPGRIRLGQLIVAGNKLMLGEDVTGE